MATMSRDTLCIDGSIDRNEWQKKFNANDMESPEGKCGQVLFRSESKKL
jgi:hypothetical protein